MVLMCFEKSLVSRASVGLDYKRKTRDSRPEREFGVLAETLGVSEVVDDGKDAIVEKQKIAEDEED